MHLVKCVTNFSLETLQASLLTQPLSIMGDLSQLLA